MAQQFVALRAVTVCATEHEQSHILRARLTYIILQGYIYTYMHALWHAVCVYVLWVTTMYVHTCIQGVKYNHTDCMHVCRIGVLLLLGQVTCDFMITS